MDIPNEKGDNLKAYIIKPKNFNPNNKYPVLLYTYGGPGIQTVINSWDSFNYWWHQMLAQQGYIIVSVDGRGTGGRGDAFKKATYKQLGKLELEDQIAAAKWLKSQPYIDGDRIGIWGWSFGGYLTSLCMTKGNGLFKMGIAVAPVTSWRYYDTIYTERFLQTPQDNSHGYDDNSPINFAHNLQGNYLIIHGTADDNVHFQNSMEMIEALIQEGKQFDTAIYPDKDHSIYGGKTRYQLYQKMTNYIKANL
jgi:dipeptidyl-peptidase-4